MPQNLLTTDQIDRPTSADLAFACDAIAAASGVSYEDVAQEFDESDPPLFILCEVNREGGDDYFTGHVSPEAAVFYSNEQEYSEDWRLVGLYDVKARGWYVGTVTVRIEHREEFKAP